MEKQELADQYISEVSEENPGISGNTPIVIALIRACGDLLIAKDELKRYKERVVEDRRNFLADYLGVPRSVVDSVLDRGAEWRAEPGTPPASTDPLTPRHTPLSDRLSGRESERPRMGPLSRALEDAKPDPDLVRCPNCGSWARYVKHADEVITIECTMCGHQEER